jgi:phage-related protein
MKIVAFLGNYLARIQAFPLDARQDAGFQLDMVQRGDNPDDWKPVNTIGKGVKEIRIRKDSGHYRVIYLERLKDAVYVLHAFRKKTQKIRKMDIHLARKRLKEIGGYNG